MRQKQNRGLGLGMFLVVFLALIAPSCTVIADQEGAPVVVGMHDMNDNQFTVFAHDLSLFSTILTGRLVRMKPEIREPAKQIIARGLELFPADGEHDQMSAQFARQLPQLVSDVDARAIFELLINRIEAAGGIKYLDTGGILSDRSAAIIRSVLQGAELAVR